MSEFYSQESARGFRWNDPDFGIRLPVEVVVISERDAALPRFQGARPHMPRRRLPKPKRRRTPRASRCTHWCRELYPICRSIKRRRSARNPAPRRRSHCAEGPRSPYGHRRHSTGRCPRNGTSATLTSRTQAERKSSTSRNRDLHVLITASGPGEDAACRTTLDLYSLPEHPDWIRTRPPTTRKLGFCLEPEAARAAAEGTYEVVVDSTLEAGHLTYGECFSREPWPTRC